MSTPTTVHAASHTLTLLPQRAVWWAAARTLLVADVHLGKGAAFRALGQPVPRGSSAANLEVLSHLIASHRAERLLVLGDWWHSREGLSAPLRERITTWRAAHASLDVGVVVGNHDQPIQATLAELGLTPLQEPFFAAPDLTLWHDVKANDAASDAFHLSGHIHPAVRVPLGAGGSVRAPCFVWTPQHLLLPAFGQLTGHHTLRADDVRLQGARVFVPDAATGRTLEVTRLLSP